MRSDQADPAVTPDPEETRRRLTSETAEVEGAMKLVASGAALRITLSGLAFGDELARRFRAEAQSRGLRIEPILWPEDAGCDLIVRRIDE